MATTLTYTNSAFTPFTKISSTAVNQYFTDIRSRINWAGGTSAVTGLGDDNIQSVAASGGGLTRATKLKLGTASHVVINDGTGAMSSEAQLALTRGGTGISITAASQQAGDVIQINSTLTALEIGPPTAVPASLRVYQFYNFT